MTDTLEIYGTEYQSVKGFKVTDSNGDIQRFVDGFTFKEIADGTRLSGDIVLPTATEIRSWAFYRKPVTSVSAPYVTTIGGYAFDEASTLASVSFPSLTTFTGIYVFRGTTNLKRACFPSLTGLTVGNVFNGSKFETLVFPAAKISGMNGLNGMTSLTTVDFGESFEYIGTYLFNGDSALNTLILRSEASLVALKSTNGISSTCFKSGGTGGTIYIPKALYDHLGDGSSLDYKSATNWSTYEGYGTITWAKIEGSQYETHYADGTEIS